jgi:hypothetical protein
MRLSRTARPPISGGLSWIYVDGFPLGSSGANPYATLRLSDFQTVSLTEENAGALSKFLPDPQQLCGN